MPVLDPPHAICYNVDFGPCFGREEVVAKQAKRFQISPNMTYEADSIHFEDDELLDELEIFYKD